MTIEERQHGFDVVDNMKEVKGALYTETVLAMGIILTSVRDKEEDRKMVCQILSTKFARLLTHEIGRKVTEIELTTDLLTLVECVAKRGQNDPKS